MTKIALSLVSFIAGAFFAFSLSAGIQMSAEAQLESSTINVSAGYETPAVQPLDPTKVSERISISGNAGAAVRLDGINCKECTFGDSAFVYGGGAINCIDCRFTSPEVTVILTGAAFNTAKLLQSLQEQKAAPVPQLPPWLANPNPKIAIALNPQAMRKLSLTLLRGQ